MGLPKNRRYWDSNCFLGWLAAEEDKVDRCRGVIRAAEKGELVIVTSSFTTTEVIKLEKKTPLPPDKEHIITDFFKQDWIYVRQLDPRIAELSRHLIWHQGIAQKDSIHVATALTVGVVQLDTFDKDLIKKSGTIGDPLLKIGRPDVPEQLRMDS